MVILTYAVLYFTDQLGIRQHYVVLIAVFLILDFRRVLNIVNFL